MSTTVPLSKLIVFEGHEPTSRTTVRVIWDPADPETVHVLTLATGDHARWSRPLECQRKDNP